MPIGKLAPGAWVLARVGTEQLSVAVGAAHAAVAVVPVVVRLILDGQLEITGAVISLEQALNVCTMILKEQVDVLLAASRAV
jgi:hypothetical protein